MSPANKAHFESEKEAIHMILTGIGDENLIHDFDMRANSSSRMWDSYRKEIQKIGSPCKSYFKKLYKTTNNNLRTSSNTINKNVDTTLRYKNDNQSGQFGNQRTMTIAEARETVGGQVQYLSINGLGTGLYNDRDGDAFIQGLKSDLLQQCSAQTTKSTLSFKIQESRKLSIKDKDSVKLLLNKFFLEGYQV
ncbi:hypothetical protein Tco_0213436 [Tanacetum coccineum]